MILRGKVNYFWDVTMQVDDEGRVGEPQMVSGIMERHFMWLFNIISQLKALAWLREGEEPQFEVAVNKDDADAYHEKFPHCYLD